MSNEEVHAQYVESINRNEIDVSLTKCMLCTSPDCKMYSVVVNSRTHIVVTQCRKIKIIESKVKNPEDYWLIDYDDFLNAKRESLEEFF